MIPPPPPIVAPYVTIDTANAACRCPSGRATQLYVTALVDYEPTATLNIVLLNTEKLREKFLQTRVTSELATYIFNIDEDVDKLIIYPTTNQGEVWIQSLVLESTDCDWNRDGTRDSNDFFVFLLAWYANDADFNHDGVTNTQDFYDFQRCGI